MENDYYRGFPSKSLTKQSFRVCFFFRRRFRLRAVEPPGDVKIVFESFSNDGIMSVDHLVRFLKEYQDERNTTKEYAESIFSSLRYFNFFQRRGLHVEAFFRYLLSDNNSILPSNEVSDDMGAPLAHYFLYTGHNSYLTGNQLSSVSSVEPIIRALKRGVRVIELDLWPNKRRDGVDVRHGGTLTAPVGFISCLRAIKEYAFLASEYPVILTFEDHLTPDLQSKVAFIVIRTFEEMLFCPKSELTELPSPVMLKRKIIISTKPPKEYTVKASAKKEHMDVSDESDYHLEGDKNHVIPEYGHLIAIHARKTYGETETWLSDDPNTFKRVSLSEQKLDNAIRTHGTDIIRFTQRNLIRVYPKGSRIDSSNYNPIVGWAHGVQMVAFNMQGHDKFLWIMQGMFRANGVCGFVKKPDFLLNPDICFDPHMEVLIKTTLKVKVYMGVGWHLDFRHNHFDLYSPPDFYTKVGIAGVPRDTITKRTKVIKDEWFPMWNEEFEFHLRVPELAFLQLEVIEFNTSGKRGFGGQICLPFSELRNGIRSVPLHDRRGDKYRSVKLLLHFLIV